MIDYAVARANMVENQLRPSRIDDPGVLKAMGEVPRELFVPEPLRGCAYGDEDLALGGGRHLIEPLALAKLLQAAAHHPSGRGPGGRRRHRLRRRDRVPPGGLGVLPAARCGVLASRSKALLAVARRRQCGAGAWCHPGRACRAHAPFDLILLIGSVPGRAPGADRSARRRRPPRRPWSSTAAAARSRWCARCTVPSAGSLRSTPRCIDCRVCRREPPSPF